MSIAAYCVAVRDYLRANLTDFYDNDTTAAYDNCRVMIDEHPTAKCGQEFIAIYGSYHQPRSQPIQALDEEFGITIAISRKIALVPPDRRGELGYIDSYVDNLPAGDDTDRFLSSWVATEARCREIVKLLVGHDRYLVMKNANDLLSTGSPFTEPLIWLGTDAKPQQVGADFFWSYDQVEPETDNVFGFVQKIYMGEAVRLQPIPDLDQENSIPDNE